MLKRVEKLVSQLGWLETVQFKNAVREVWGGGNAAQG